MQAFSARNYFEDQYVLRKTIPTFADHIAEWEALSSAENFKDLHVDTYNFGDHPRQNFELIKTNLEPSRKGLAIFIHGGFWRAMDREQSRFMARPFIDNGYDCIISEYRLMPEFRLGELVDDTVQMLHRVGEMQDRGELSDNLLLTGHSAGAHLAAFGLKQASAQGFKVNKCSLIYFSGVFDINPVSITSIGDELNMPHQEVANWSVHIGNADNGIAPLFVVGDDETEEFKRQSIIGAQHLGHPTSQNILQVPDANHLTLMTKFASEKPLTEKILTHPR